MAKKLVFLVLLLIIIPQIIAEDYYADIDVNVDSAGFVTIEGKTDHTSLLAEDSQKYTSKTGDYWLLNISNDDKFSDYVYSILLPEQSSINYIKSSSDFRIEQKEGRLAVKGFGQDQPISIIVQYQIGKAESDISKAVLIVSSLAALALILFFLLRSMRKRRISRDSKEKKEDFDIKGLTSRQKSIVKVLITENKPLTQAKIQSLLNLPKASVSRNIHSLELKGIIEKERIGMSNLIKLKR